MMTAKIHGRSFDISQVITRDVCVIGGGSSGTYSAIGLRDRGKSVVVIEKEDRLGGHTRTYIDPLTGGTIDIGVIVFHNTSTVQNYFRRFSVSLTTFEFSSSVTQYVDFRTGQVDETFVPTSSEAISTGLQAYAAQLAKYPYLDNGFYLPDPVPEDLLLPFGEFVTKYDLASMVGVVFQYGQGLGDLLSKPTLYVLKLIGTATVTSILEGFLTTARHDNELLYEAAQSTLGSDVLLNSTIIAMDRGGDGNETDYATIIVNTPTGQVMTQCKKIVSSIPPKIDNLQGYDLSANETRLFSQFFNVGYYTGVLRNSGIPDNTTVKNVAAETPYNLPPFPAVYGNDGTGVPNLINAKYGSNATLPDDQVKADILAKVQALDFPGKNTSAEPEFAIYRSHAPFLLHVSSEAIAAGFYADLYALQGQKRTFYTGAAFHTHDSSLLWEFTEALLPQIAA